MSSSMSANNLPSVVIRRIFEVLLAPLNSPTLASIPMYKAAVPLMRVNRLWRQLGAEIFCRNAILDIYEERPDLFGHDGDGDEAEYNRLISLETCSNIQFIIARDLSFLAKTLTISLGNLADPDNIIRGLSKYGFFDKQWPSVQNLAVIFDSYDMQQTGDFGDSAVSDLNRRLLEVLPNVCGIHYAVYLDNTYGQPLIADFIRKRSESLTRLDFETDIPRELAISSLPKALTSLRYSLGPHSATKVFPKVFAKSLKSLTLGLVGIQGLWDLFFDDGNQESAEFTNLVDLDILFDTDGQDSAEPLLSIAGSLPRFPKLAHLKLQMFLMDASEVLSMFPVHQLVSLVVRRGRNSSLLDISAMPKLLSLVLDTSPGDSDVFQHADPILPLFMSPTPLRKLVLMSEFNIGFPMDASIFRMLEELDISRARYSAPITDILSLLPKLKKLVIYISPDRELGATPVLGPSVKDSLSPVHRSLEFLEMTPTWHDLEPVYVEHVVWFVARLPSLLKWQYERVLGRQSNFVAELFDDIMCSEPARASEITHLRGLIMCDSGRRF